MSFKIVRGRRMDLMGIQPDTKQRHCRRELRERFHPVDFDAGQMLYEEEFTEKEKVIWDRIEAERNQRRDSWLAWTQDEDEEDSWTAAEQSDRPPPRKRKSPTQPDGPPPAVTLAPAGQGIQLQQEALDAANRAKRQTWADITEEEEEALKEKGTGKVKDEEEEVEEEEKPDGHGAEDLDKAHEEEEPAADSQLDSPPDPDKNKHYRDSFAPMDEDALEEPEVPDWEAQDENMLDTEIQQAQAIEPQLDPTALSEPLPDHETDKAQKDQLTQKNAQLDKELKLQQLKVQELELMKELGLVPGWTSH